MATVNLETLTPVHLPERSRFEIPLGDGDVAEIDYRIDGDTITMFHTGVPSEYQGQGIAAVITKYALDWARENGYTVNPLCSYIRVYIQRHPEYRANTRGI